MTDLPHLDAGIYTGEVRHARYAPKRHRFIYRVFSCLFDVDSLETYHQNLKWFSLNRFNLFSLWQKDHAAKDGTAIRPFLDKLISQAGLNRPDKILMLCYPRILGIGFNPITIYYCYVQDQISAMIYEVRNTFGGDHLYVIPLKNEDELANHNRKKQLHVSPFMGMEASYGFTAEPPNDKIKFVIREYYKNKPILIASFIGEKKQLTDSALLTSFLKHPLMMLKVVIGIHYEALKIFAKGVPYVKGQNKPDKRISF